MPDPDQGPSADTGTTDDPRHRLVPRSPVSHRQEPIHGLATAGRSVGSCPHPRPCPRNAIWPSKIHSWIAGSATRFLDHRGGRHAPDRAPVFSGQRHRPRRHRTDRGLDHRRTALVSQPAPGTRLPWPPARAAPGFAGSRFEPRAMGHRDNLVRGPPPARRAGRHRHKRVRPGIARPQQSGHAALPSDGGRLAEALDVLAADVARTLPAGSSAGGEQPKFLAVLASGQHVLVKFTPPRGTPFRRSVGRPAAGRGPGQQRPRGGMACRSRRPRSSKVPAAPISSASGSIGWANAAGAMSSRWEPRTRPSWQIPTRTGVRPASRSPGNAACCSSEGAERATALLQFGRLIGNADMHAGNLGLMVQARGLGQRQVRAGAGLRHAADALATGRQSGQRPGLHPLRARPGQLGRARRRPGP